MINNLKLIQNNFNQAASSYLGNQKIQAYPALKIRRLLGEYLNEGLILDLGSGPGTLRHNDELYNDRFNAIIALDLSLKMLKNVKNYATKVCSDAHQLPFTDNSFTVIISNLMFQWSSNPSLLFNEINRILKPNGKLIFTTLIKPSLFELQKAWKNIDNHDHTLNFLNKNLYINLLRDEGFQLNQLTTWRNTIYFPNLTNLLKHFKSTGTTLIKSNCNKGLGGKQKLTDLSFFYEKIRTTKGLPLTYVYLLVVATKLGD